MKVNIDTSAKTISIGDETGSKQFDLFSAESFDALSRLWIDIGWVRKYPYAFSWLGRPIIQLPEDIIRAQEVIYRVKPDVILETGVAHGGSLVFYASLCKAIGNGRVIGVDVEIRPRNRAAIEAHELFSYITLIEGNSVTMETVDKVKSLIKPGETVMVILDSSHTKSHVLAELGAYAGLVTKGSYICVEDGVMHYVAGMPRTKDDWAWNNPKSAAEEFAKEHPEFEIVSLPRGFDESQGVPDCTHHPSGWLLRR